MSERQEMQARAEDIQAAASWLVENRMAHWKPAEVDGVPAIILVFYKSQWAVENEKLKLNLAERK
jgi:hypothetical protein